VQLREREVEGEKDRKFEGEREKGRTEEKHRKIEKGRYSLSFFGTFVLVYAYAHTHLGLKCSLGVWLRGWRLGCIDLVEGFKM